jgi:hypothetical protein
LWRRSQPVIILLSADRNDEKPAIVIEQAATARHFRNCDVLSNLIVINSVVVD